MPPRDPQPWLCFHINSPILVSFEEREQIGIDDVCVRRDHAVRQVFVGLQRAVLEAWLKVDRRPDKAQSGRPRYG